MENLRRLLPHSKKESKMDKRDTLSAINEVEIEIGNNLNLLRAGGTIY